MDKVAIYGKYFFTLFIIQFILYSPSGNALQSKLNKALFTDSSGFALLLLFKTSVYETHGYKISERTPLTSYAANVMAVATTALAVVGIIPL